MPEHDSEIGWLHIDADGGWPVDDVRAMLAAVNGSYQATARVELAAIQFLAVFEPWERYAAPPRNWPYPPQPTAASAVAAPADRLIITRVVLESPGFWEFLGALNPLEVVRQYLNDRHERQKDKSYRNAAEQERLALQNALSRLEVVERIAQLQREYCRDLFLSEAWRAGWIGELRPPLNRLAEFDERGMINGDSATTVPEPSEPRHLPPPDDAER